MIRHIRARLDFPGVACKECEKSRQIEGDIPDCETAKGCIIPLLGEKGVRAMAIRDKLMKLRKLVDPQTILTAYGATVDDLEMLIRLEDTFEKVKNG
ncbi:MAG TPA: hypothetical protein VGJ94_07250 [Syntrophorhabdaceae bacterium]|jgi:hypothetical protein